MKEIAYYILHYGSHVLVGFVVWYFMKTKHNKELWKKTLEAYIKGKEDGIDIILREQNGNKN